MKSNRAKGNYYAKKTKDLLEKEGWVVANTETTKMAWIKGRMIPIHTDIWASDLMAMNGKDLIFIQVKSEIDSKNSHVGDARKEFAKYPFPKYIKRYIYNWKPRQKPEIIECKNK